MDGPKTVSAAFEAAPKVKVGAKGFATLQAACDDAATANNSLIKLLEGNLGGALAAGRSITVTLEGGDNAAYSAVNTKTTIQAPVALSAGTVRMNGIVIH